MKIWMGMLLGVILSLFALPLWASVNINTADVAALDSLPGIGPAKAQAIVEYRKAHGSFKTLDDLARVHGIGSKLLERLRPSLALDGQTTALSSVAGCSSGKAASRKKPIPAGEERAIRQGSHGYILDGGPDSNAFHYRHFSLQESS
ncbi:MULTISPECIES: ComEA family DNA-binding protein [Acidithiobacillus]|jgi:competence protein ComEA|uniref:Competence protein ComEA n=2 Tax=Acidithiobacillus thiooxidans TaxID=930 RepID=A0A1C2HWB4_ACITH|nr:MULTISPECIES: ComEA family DNA-binding protein [Acidithiobacillus]MBE7567452.1 ComEA family DNA-binding protein [Acidithiobacillus sp. HP-11]MBU2741984.1 helix-hairpin-helix domain-containing protein [Acidithiobacillus albertensis]MBU2752549.1 helix-hairpin-helix domain-containing protein [Acidithiobacillus thiooxidans]MBU2792997.1 helix-hairpin-helix domain-containing protein [Acidithiobacillus thiooxidans]MBU2834921.1 helix-hairpin-helix domain-containing protein [Acidithiobacillus thioox